MMNLTRYRLTWHPVAGVCHEEVDPDSPLDERDYVRALDAMEQKLALDAERAQYAARLADLEQALSITKAELRLARGGE